MLTLNTDLSSDDFDFIDGSPFFVQHAMTVTRPPSPSVSFDFSIVSPPSPSPDRNSFPSLPHPRHGSSQTSLSSLRWLGTSTGDRRYNASQGLPSYHTPGQRSPHTAKSMKCLIPRLWGALSSPTRKGRRKAARRKAYNALPPNISYADLQPLDGEEGELVDEACFVDSGNVLYPPPRFAGSFPIFCHGYLLKPCFRLFVPPPSRNCHLPSMLPRSFVHNRLSERLTQMEHPSQ